MKSAWGCEYLNWLTRGLGTFIFYCSFLGKIYGNHTKSRGVPNLFRLCKILEKVRLDILDFGHVRDNESTGMRTCVRTV